MVKSPHVCITPLEPKQLGLLQQVSEQEGSGPVDNPRPSARIHGLQMCLQPTPYYLVGVHVPKVQLSCEILRFFQEGIQVLSLMTLKGTLWRTALGQESPKATKLGPVLKQYPYRSRSKNK